jgi:hypothetical protein
MSVSADRLPEPPPSLDRERGAELSACTRAALLRQRRELAESIEEAFEHIPRPLRGAVRRIIGG